MPKPAAHEPNGNAPESQSRRAVLVIMAAAVVLVILGAFGARALLGSVLGSGAPGSPEVDSPLADPADRPERSLLQAFGDRQARSFLSANPELLAPISDSVDPVEFEVFSGESVSSIAERLAGLGLVRDARAVEALARLGGLDTLIQAGSHTVRPDMPTEDVLNALLIATGDEVVITLREGLRAEEIADSLESVGLAGREDFIERVTVGETLVPIVADRPEGSSLEGYLFPDTYRFEPEAGAQVVLQTLLETFAARVPSDFTEAASAQNLSVYEAVTLASIVEREAVLASERPRIARVFLNRLDEAPFFLNADPTIQYAMGFQVETESWWKRPLLTVDLQIDSPYNSYLTPGLPPSPIASPGLSSLEAVIEPEDGDWQYFVADDIACDGTHVFANTYEEHLANVDRYRTGECGG